ncbi:LysR substrate-binding domain-containing protein [Aromatoleum sp.]|uniref:LysR substrate-binding domain-containing protein n=1 Tax=Aromatoleum sp. TaxID=2307007 RepID=UPI002FCABE09
MAESQSATLRFAATHALSFTFLPGWLRAIESRIAMGPVRLVSDVLQRCEAMLLHGEVQFVLSHAHPQVPGALQAQGYPSLVVGADRLVPVSAPDADGRPRHALVADGAEQPVTLLSYSPESGMDRLLHEVLGPKLARLPAHSAFTAHLSSVLRTMALDGRGIAWLPDSLVADDVAAGRLVEAGAREWSIPMEVRLYRDRAPLGQAGEDFWAAVAAAA